MKEVTDNSGNIFKVCSKCGRSRDIEHENHVKEESKRNHRNLHNYLGTPWRERRLISKFLRSKRDIYV